MLLIVGAFSVCFVINLALAATAVEGWQDENGFHFGRPSDELT